MALFSKPPAKKPAPALAKRAPAPAARSGPVSARELASKAGGMAGEKRGADPVHAEEPITGASLIEWSPQQQAIEVAQANPGLCAVLENAALMFASGQAAGARTLLEEGVAGDHDARQSPLAWLALFDLLERASDRNAFDQLALQYSVLFERSAPPWEGRAASPSARKAVGGNVTITGRLTADSGPQLDGVRRAIANKAAHARLDVASIAGFDEAGAKLLAGVLAEARRAQVTIAIDHPQKLKAALDAAVQAGREGGEGAWLLSLELLQWAHDQATFDDRAIEYAIAFEVSPPSWEPPPLSMAPVETLPAESGVRALAARELEAVVLSGVLAGTAGQPMAKVGDFAHGRNIVSIDMTAVERIDFVCAGALANAVNRIESQRKAVQVFGATPIIRVLLLLIGLSPRHFVRKAA